MKPTIYLLLLVLSTLNLTSCANKLATPESNSSIVSTRCSVLQTEQERNECYRKKTEALQSTGQQLEEDIDKILNN